MEETEPHKSSAGRRSTCIWIAVFLYIFSSMPLQVLAHRDYMPEFLSPLMGRIYSPANMLTAFALPSGWYRGWYQLWDHLLPGERRISGIE